MIITVRSYGEYFQINCKTQQDMYSVKRILDSSWLWYKLNDDESTNINMIDAKDWLED